MAVSFSSALRQQKPGQSAAPSGARLSVPVFHRDLAVVDSCTAGVRPVPHFPEDQPGIQSLPPELLDLILGYLPLSVQGRCALVCRRWYRQLPDTRLRLARHLEHLVPSQRQVSAWLEDGYVNRTRPWLQAAGSQLVPALECQYQELVHQQERFGRRLLQPADQAGQRRHEAGRWLSGLVHYSLHQQMVHSRQLCLEPVVLDDPAQQSSFLRFSCCSQWMARALRQEREEEVFWRLSLCAWRQGSWQPQRLEPDPERLLSVITYGFSQCRPDTLFSAHHQGPVLCWTRQAATGCWQRRRILDVSGRGTIVLVTQNRQGDLLCLYNDQETAGTGFLLLPERGDGQHWGRVTGSHYAQPVMVRISPRCCQLAIVTRVVGADGEQPAVHIWEPGPQAVRPGSWSCVQTLLDRQDEILQLSYSPDEKHLLGLLQGGRICLWAIDARRQLVKRLDMACFLDIGQQTTQQVNLAYSSFNNVGSQLVVVCSPRLLQFWNLHESSHWQAGDVLTVSAVSGDAVSDAVRCVLLSRTGTSLLCVSSLCVHGWHRRASHWERAFRHGPVDVDAARPLAVQMPMGLCAAVIGSPGQLWIYGPDNEGYLVRKAVFNAEHQVQELQWSRDGLFLSVSYADELAPPSALQLKAPAQEDRPEQTLPGSG